MVTRKRTKHGVRSAGRAGGRHASSPKLEGLLDVGDWLDVLDLDGVWNVARVLSVPAPGEVEITYDGWPTDYDEVVHIDSDRVAPYHTFTKAVKCWVKYLNWPLWPSVITIRTPGTPEGVRNLMAENRLHVDFLDNPDFSKRDRCWQKKGQARAFETKYDTKRMATTGAQFERALGWVLQSDASTKMPRFVVGTLPVEYKNGEMERVEMARKNMGDELWFQNFTQNRMHHRLCHVYETMGDEEEDSSGDDSPSRKLNEKILNLSAMKQNPSLTGKEKKRPPPVKIELDQFPDPEVPYELEPLDSRGSDVSVSSSRGKIRSKRRRLQTRPRSSSSSKTKKAGRKEENHLSLPPASKISGRVARVVVEAKEKRASHTKGLVKMAARRSVQPLVGFLNLTPNDEPVSVQAPEVLSEGAERYEAQQQNASAMQKDSPPEQCIASNSPEQSSEDERCSDQSAKPPIDQEIADIEEKLRSLKREKKERDARSTAREVRARPHDPSPSAADAQGRPQFISPSANRIEEERSKRAISELSLLSQVDDEVHNSSHIPQLRKHAVDAGPTFVESVELDSSLVSAGKTDISDSDESKGIADVDAVATGQVHGAGDEKAEAKPSSTVGFVNLSGIGPTMVITSDTSEKESQELGGRFCMMQAAEKESSPVKEKAKGSRKTVIAVPKKFDDTTHKPTNLANIMLRPHFSLVKPVAGDKPGVALLSPSRAVFSSSKGFSMESWFKRKMMADFMAGGSPIMKR